MLPKMNGLDVCKRLRSEGSSVPIIMLTARGQEIDKVLGLKLGADDYVTKPFGFMELMARVEALLRRTSGGARHAEVYGFGDVVVDFKKAELRKARGTCRDDRARAEAARVLHRAPRRGRAARAASRPGVGVRFARR